MADLIFELWPKQLQALLSTAQLRLYGGGAGSGKSHLGRIDAIKDSLRIPGLQTYIFRRKYDDLIKNHVEGPNGFRALLDPLVRLGQCNMVEKEIRFKNGSKIYLCHCQHEKDVYNYQGAEINKLIVEEAGQFTEFIIRYLLGRMRIPANLPIPVDELPSWPRALFTANPGGVGHHFLKSMFIDGREPGVIYTLPKEEGGWTIQYIQALLIDNPSIDYDKYAASLMSLKRPELIDAYLNGKWDIALGAFLPECDERKHLIPYFDLPKHLFKFRTFDWGSQAPFWVGWWAVMDGYHGQFQNGVRLPRGFLYCYREWYGCQPGDTMRGLGMSNEQMALGIKNRTPLDENVAGTVTDSLPFQSRGAATIAEEFLKHGVPLAQGDVSPGSRIQGAQQLRSRLIGVDGVPMIGFARECKHVWRVLTQIQTDDANIEDVDTDSEDHPYDGVTLACKARKLMVKEAPMPTAQVIAKAIQPPTMGDILKIRGDGWL